MKKFLLSLATLMVAVAAVAAPTTDEVSALSLRIDKVDGATVRVKNTDGLNAVLYEDGSIILYNFEGNSPLRVYINEDGTVYAPAQAIMGYDEDTYETIYYLTVPAASKDKAPMEAYNDRITGTYENGKITLDAWNAIKTNSSFSENQGTLYNNDVTTMVVAPNATVTASYWVDDYDWDTWDFLGWTKGEMTTSDKNAYAEQDGKYITVYNYDDVNGAVKFEMGRGNSLTADPDFITFKRISSSGNQTDYTLKAIPAELTEEEVTPLDEPVGGEVVDEYHISFGNCGQFSESGNYNGSLLSFITITLDKALDLSVTGINSVESDKQVAGVKYVNLMGVESATPFQGVNIVVTTFTDGTSKAVKQLVK